MKKIFALGWMLVVALALTNCSKEETYAPTVDKDFVVYANLDESRTVADGYTTSWADGDNLSIFHAVAGEATYVSDGEFTLKNVEAGTFEGTVTGVEEGAAYDWYAYYPYDSHVTSPANTGAGYIEIAKQTQVQEGNSNTTHTSGAPLYGVVKGGSSVAPEFSMKHLSSMVKVNVTNAVDEAISIKSILVETAGTKISGTYYVDITGEEAPEYESSGANYTYTSVNLEVSGEEAIQPEASAAFYLTACPFTAEEGETITVTVTNNGDEVSVREYTIPAGKGFAPGKVTTLNFDFTADSGVEWTTIADIHAASAEGTYNIKNATVVLKMAKSCLLKDATGYLYSYQNLDVNEGDIVNITNALTSTYGERQIKSGASVEKIGTTTVEHPAATEIADGAAFSALATSYTVGDYVTVEATKITVGSYINFYVDGASHTGSLVAPVEDLSQYNNLPVKITGYAGYLNNSYFYLFPTKVEVLPYLQAKSGALTWEADELTAKTVTIDTDNDWTITSAPAWVEAVHTDVATLTVTPTEEGPADGRSGVIELAHIANPAITATVTVIQNASGALATYSWTLASGEFGTATTPKTSVTKGTPEMTWNIAYTWQTTNKYFGFDNNSGRGLQIGSGNNPVATLTVSTTQFTNKIAKVTVNAATASSGNCTIAVTVDGVALTCSKSTKLTTTATDYEFVAATPVTGEIVITYKNSAKKAVYLKSIKINE